MMGKLIKDSFYLKLVSIIVGLLTVSPILNSKIGDCKKIMVFWGIFVLGYALWKNWKFFLKREYIILALFIGAYAVTILVNVREHMFGELANLAYMGIFLLVLTYCDRSKDKKTIQRELLIIFRCIVVVTMFFAVSCMVMFLFSLDGIVKVGDMIFPYGTWEGRLWGFYNPNTGAVLNYISFIMSILLLNNSEVKNVWKKILYCNIVLQGGCFALTQSRGADVAFLTYVILYFLFIRKQEDLDTKKKTILRRCLWAYCAVAVVLLTSQMAFNISSYAKSGISSVIYTKEQKEEKKITKRREIKKGSLETETSGRAGLWKVGMDVFLDHPILGIGADSIQDAMRENLTYKWYKNSKGGGLHCIYITVFASCGLAGGLCFVAFLVVICWKGLWFFLDQRKEIFEKCVMAFIPAWLVGDLVESRIILSTGILAIIFWIFIGYTMFYLDKAGEVKE